MVKVQEKSWGIFFKKLILNPVKQIQQIGTIFFFTSSKRTQLKKFSLALTTTDKPILNLTKISYTKVAMNYINHINNFHS